MVQRLFGHSAVTVEAHVAMHIEILVEDLSGKALLECLMAKFVDITYRIHSYRGVGKLPPGLKPGTDASKRILLDQLPRLLQGYGRSLPPGQLVLVVFDSDRNSCQELLTALKQLAAQCEPCPNVMFRLAIEEMEAWILGDQEAILKEYPKAKVQVLQSYQPDSICGTWEVLAEAVYPGGAKKLKAQGFQAIGREKHRWAREIGPHLKLDSNQSPSFKKFVSGVRRTIGST